MQTGQLQLTLKGHTDRVLGVCFSPDGKHLASGGWDQTKVWDVPTGQQTLLFKETATSLYFSPDGKRIASVGDGGTLWIGDAATGQVVFTDKGDGNILPVVCFSANGKRLAIAFNFIGVADSPAPIQVLDAVTGQAMFTLVGYPEGTFSLCFSPDGKRIVSANMDNTVRVWDSATGQEALTLEGHVSPVTSVCFSRNGNVLASGDLDGTVKVWDAGVPTPRKKP